MNLVRATDTMFTAAHQEFNIRLQQKILTGYKLDFGLIARIIFPLMLINLGLVPTLEHTIGDMDRPHHNVWNVLHGRRPIRLLRFPSKRVAAR